MQPNSYVSNAPASKKGMPKWAKVLIGVVVGLVALIAIGIAAIFFFVNIFTSAPLKVSNNFMNAVQASDAEAAYALTSPGFQETTSRGQLDAMISSINPHFQGEEEVIAEKIETKDGTNHAAVVYKVTNGMGTSYLRIDLSEGDGWQVTAIKNSDKELSAEIE